MLLFRCKKNNHSDRMIKQTKIKKFKYHDVRYNCYCYGGELKEGNIKPKKITQVWGNGICSRIVG